MQHTRKRPRALLSALFVIATVVSACDRVGEIVILPEFDVAYSFESGLEGWYASGLDLTNPVVAWNIGSESGEASTGARAAHFNLDNANGRAKIWLEREFDVEPERAYTIEITLDFATTDDDPSVVWRILAGAHVAPPQAAGNLTVQDGTGHAETGTQGPVWIEKRYVVQAAADEDGKLFATVGVWGTNPASRSYWIDNVHLVFTRMSAGG